ncbi:hypothetical protein GDO86_018711 [Hymenochirus boettgeri]|uniref:Uncharacterized protein n=1 Tax=Hymenochirus boettgeri TaxID=247094 RepID=A0A8T2IEP6_9PIPI|nr:hypothetical protein GDO86_018711 [Hymenochirus boettgeri]
MASADLRDELNCSICLNIYTDPVMLPCGHNFCETCHKSVLDIQEGSGVYSCPECRAEFVDRPALIRNRKLRNIAERFVSTHPENGGTGISCTYCIHFPVPAVKSCLLCEASLCDNHLKVHSKSSEHVLTEPTTSAKKRICPLHKEPLKYYCYVDASCICASCCLAGQHRRHKVELVSEAFEKKKEKLKNYLQTLPLKREETTKKVQSLQDHKNEMIKKAVVETERVTVLFRDIRERLESLENRVLAEISKQEDNISLHISDLIQQLERKEDELSENIRHTEELCNINDPITFLQVFCCPEREDNKESEGIDIKVPYVRVMDGDQISETLLTGLADIVTGIGSRIHWQETTDMLLDINTASNNVSVSEDRKTVSWTSGDQLRSHTPERFHGYQVLSTRRFPSGRYYWDVEVSESGSWRVGVAYPSIGRKGNQFWIGNNNKSWCLWRWNNAYSVRHDSNGIDLLHHPSCQRIRISLDYEAGHLSFFELSNPIKHLHTFNTTFSEPLHAAFWVWKDTLRGNSWVKMIN